MSTYIIGDVQGCFSELQALLNIINFDPAKDRLGFTGDLINRGPDSLNTLRFIQSLNDPIVVLGNHDFHFLALAGGQMIYEGNHTLQPLLNAPDCLILADWLRQQPLIYYDASLEFCVVHAGIPPQWSLISALDYAAEVEVQLQSDDFSSFVKTLYGDEPIEWTENLSGMSRLRYIVNALTRMRYCDYKGKLDLVNKNNYNHKPGLHPWFYWYELSPQIIFGHWAALGGRCFKPKCVAIDTGCAWGGGLTAYRVEDGRRFYMPAFKKYK